MIRYLLVFLLIFTSGFAKIKLEDIDSKPPCHAKDFMIWQFLKQNITPSQADKAYKQVNNNKSSKLFYAYAKKTKNKKIKYELSCKNRSNLLAIKQSECLELAFSPLKATRLSKKQRKKLAKKLKSKPNIDLLSILNEKRSIDAYRDYDANTILRLFNSTGYKYRKKYLNMYLDKEFLNSLTSSYRISKFIKRTVHNHAFKKLQRSLLKMDGENLNSRDNFYLALNHLRYNNKKNAVEFFKLSRSKAKYKINVDKNDFWIYQVTNDKKYLNKLLKSMDINMYTLFAREKMNVEVNNYFCDLVTNSKEPEKSLSDPFHWSEIQKEIKATKKDELFQLAQNYKQKEMLPVQAYILQKAYEHNKHAYIMPYDKYLEGLSKDNIALFYALMRQESLMIPAALSRSYALGLMQMMPFVTDDLSKRIKKPIKNYDDMFEPENNIRYSRAHIKWMQKSLYHPLFIAYAYNGGMGFLKKYLRGSKFKKGEYEPFLSMEMMTNSESREYGKKVLANYVMYKKVLGEEVSIVNLFDTLVQPKKTDRFRAKG
ncbi:MAG: lytic transglycosylase domain-containing protein [Sulfurimonas sp.]|nr:lytic transglycosylase domain-containing protein [Sulfurimonas sp.]